RNAGALLGAFGSAYQMRSSTLSLIRIGNLVDVRTMSARELASTWSSFLPYGNARNSSRYAPFQSALIISTLLLLTWTAKGLARVCFSPLSGEKSRINPASSLV